ncbi:MAG: TasA family protein [Candidatus Scatosoma sp.]
MKNARALKRTLLTGIITIILCVYMLIGTTFAWFTDTSSVSVGKIQAGRLDVELLMWNGSRYENISENPNPIFGAGSIAQNNNAETVWEPGKTQVAYLAIVNSGNLSLK